MSYDALVAMPSKSVSKLAIRSIRRVSMTARDAQSVKLRPLCEYLAKRAQALVNASSSMFTSSMKGGVSWPRMSLPRETARSGLPVRARATVTASSKT